MDKHYGQIVEYVVRKVGFNISELAKRTDINRRTLYNWFKQKDLRSCDIYRIGCVIKHDFSREFPELFTADDFKELNDLRRSTPFRASQSTQNDEEYWKLKYYDLLEQLSVTFPSDGDPCTNYG